MVNYDGDAHEQEQMMMTPKVASMTCSGELVVKVRLCGEIMAEPPGLTRRPEHDSFRFVSHYTFENSNIS